MRGSKCTAPLEPRFFGRMTTLRHYRLCPHSRSIRILLGELKIAASLVEDKPWTWPEDLLAINPAGALPVLITGDNEAICGSYAISEWLSDDVVREHPDTPSEEANAARQGSVFPGPARDRAEVRRLVDWFHGKMHREVTDFLLQEKVYARFSPQGGGSPDAEILRSVQSNMRLHLRYLEHLTSARKFIAGEVLSFADMAAVGQVSVVDYLGAVDWSGQENAKLWYARMKSRPSIREILAERVPGAPPPPDYYDDPDF